MTGTRHDPFCEVSARLSYLRSISAPLYPDDVFAFLQSAAGPLPAGVPARYLKHMMVVADLASGDAGAIEDAIEAAWQLQRSAG
jgi:hypothetical protein